MVCKKETMPVNIVLVIAPHPDDETLGCGGALLRHIAEGDQVHWLIMSTITEEHGYSKDVIIKRAEEISKVAKAYHFVSVNQAKFVTTRLDTYPKRDLIQVVSATVNKLTPNIIYTPYRHDVHSDHTEVFDAVASCTKSFRYPFIFIVRAYETLSETEFNIRSDDRGFQPNLWIEISEYLEEKIGIMKLYEGEMKKHPFPRSERNIRALATLRGATAGVDAAEAFVTLKEVL
jgi:N-acetylglucosamine malate deacetylase 1